MELLTEALRLCEELGDHAQASEVEVTVTLQPSGLRFCIRDNGIGFLVTDVHPVSGGNGLTNMRRRIGALGSILEIHSQPGHGTQIQFAVAVKQL